MSVYAYMYVWECSKQKSTSLLMLLALADYANQETGECFPGIPSLAEKMRTSERNVQLLLRRLEDDKEITIKPNEGMATGTGNTNRYVLNGYVGWYQAVKKISSLNADVTDEGVKDSVARGETSGSQGVKKVSPKPLVEPLKNRKRSTRAPSKKWIGEDALIDIWAGVRKLDAIRIGADYHTKADRAAAKVLLEWSKPPTEEEIRTVMGKSKSDAYAFSWLEQDIIKLRTERAASTTPKVSYLEPEPEIDPDRAAGEFVPREQVLEGLAALREKMKAV